MLGAIAGDIIGSAYEFTRQKRYDFEMVPPGSRFTDDTVMTLAVAHWLCLYIEEDHPEEKLIETMQKYGREYPFAGYGSSFNSWLWSENPQPYNSWGNGAAMRVSPVGLYARTLDDALDLAKRTAEVSHNHPAGITGAQAVAASVWMDTPKMKSAIIYNAVSITTLRGQLTKYALHINGMSLVKVRCRSQSSVFLKARTLRMSSGLPCRSEAMPTPWPA